MENYQNKYFDEIERKKYKDFNTFFESDEFNKIGEEDEEMQRKIFYYYALKYSSERSKNINQLYIDLKKIMVKMDMEQYKKYDPECFIFIVNNYLEKIQIFISENKFFEVKKNYNDLRDILKLFQSQFIKKKNAQKKFLKI